MSLNKTGLFAVVSAGLLGVYSLLQYLGGVTDPETFGTAFTAAIVAIIAALKTTQKD